MSVDSLGKRGSVVDEWMDGCERVGQVEQSRVLLLPSAISLEYCTPLSSVVATSPSPGLPKYCFLGRFPVESCNPHSSLPQLPAFSP